MASGRRSLAEDIADLLEPVAVQGMSRVTRIPSPGSFWSRCASLRQLCHAGSANVRKPSAPCCCNAEAEPDAHVVLDGGPTLEESDEDLAGVLGMGRARILPDIALDDPAYAGVRSSRATAFESEDFTHDAAEEPAESPRGSDASTSQSEDERPGHPTEPQGEQQGMEFCKVAGVILGMPGFQQLYV